MEAINYKPDTGQQKMGRAFCIILVLLGILKHWQKRSWPKQFAGYWMKHRARIKDSYMRQVLSPQVLFDKKFIVAANKQESATASIVNP